VQSEDIWLIWPVYQVFDVSADAAGGGRECVKAADVVEETRCPVSLHTPDRSAKPSPTHYCDSFSKNVFVSSSVNGLIVGFDEEGLHERWAVGTKLQLEAISRANCAILRPLLPRANAWAALHKNSRALSRTRGKDSSVCRLRFSTSLAIGSAHHNNDANASLVSVLQTIVAWIDDRDTRIN